MRYHLLPLSAAIAAVLYPLAATADQTNNDNDQIEKITVTGKYSVSKTIDTATGLGLTLRETPQSVSILTAERIQDQALNTVVDVVNNAVGLSSTKVDNVRNGFTARGFAVQNYQIDGVPLSWSLGGDAGETVSDVSLYERVEVVRGATGLLTGAGDPSASINLVRKHADATELTGSIQLDAGSWAKKQVTADVGSKLNSDGTVRGRLVAKYVDNNSFQNYYEDHKTILYGVVDTDITNSTLLRVGMVYNNNDPHGAMWGGLPAVFADGSAADWDVSTTTGADWTRWESTNKNYFANLNHMFSNGWQLVANYNRMEYETQSRLIYMSGVFNAATGTYTALDAETGAGLVGQRYNAHAENNSNNFDLQLKGDYELFSRSHEFVMGALYSKQKMYTDTYNPNPIVGGTAYDANPVTNFYDWQHGNTFGEPEWDTTAARNQELETEQKGFYAATRLAITDELKVIAGGRISSWNREGINWGNATFGNNGEFVPYLGALYDLNEQHRIYASYTEIFNPQNARTADGSFIDPLEGKAYELGLKSSFFDDRLHTTVAVFKIDQDNLAVSDPNFEPTPDQLSASIGAKGTESEGFEFEVVGQPIDGWNVTAGYSQFKAENADGERVQTDTPRKQLKLFTTYQFQEVLPELTVGGGINWQSEAYSESATTRIEQGAYSLVNLMARYDINDSMDIQVNVENLFDKKYYAYMTSNALYGYNFYHYGTPRNFTVSFKYRF
ncbi:TonB-dependent siderophore receptor [Shewanella sp. C32]|uniref:TonB-dependent siderophore receptor n=1 Tax=Shewanella electrica TaxID=515560 RepID=A0ABT2FM56_9GAMM|nr:TonB-dependent siderophore receptor [Shewanella electrica]MCH1925767.1 TonB-dependent siderophore receptor [Shewanella electrica]MCS4557348.1 TonB-dependent siderophore receptor [Shewanella electrica]